MVTLKVKPKHTEVICSSDQKDDIDNLIGKVCSAVNPQARFSTAYTRGFIDNRFYLYKNGSFPTGLLMEVLVKLEKEKISWDLFSEEKYSYLSDMLLPKNLNLRDYQKTAIQDALTHGRGIINIPMNGGKSIVAFAIAYNYAVQCKYRSLILVKRNEGVKQMLNLFSSFVPKRDIGGEPTDGKKFTIMTYAKAGRRDLSEFDVVICDEVQVVGADTIFKTAMSADNAYHVFGLSGTPQDREDGKNIFVRGATGSIIFDNVHHQDLIDRGFSAKTTIYMVETHGSPCYSRDWGTVEEEGIVKNTKRNELIVETALNAHELGRKILIQVRRLEHGDILKSLIESKLDIVVPFTHGKQSSFERDRNLKQFKEGKFQVLIASAIWDDSVDIPDIEVLINAAGLKSKIATKQKLGRGLRNPGGEKKLCMIDFYDQHNYILRRHSDRRKKNYEEDGFAVLVVSDFRGVLNEGSSK